MNDFKKTEKYEVYNYASKYFYHYSNIFHHHINPILGSQSHIIFIRLIKV